MSSLETGNPTIRQMDFVRSVWNKIRTQLEGTVPMTQAHSMDDAVRLAFHQAAPGNTVLLAPACASFDMFQNYEHRGREFKAAVGRLQVTGNR